MHFDNFAAVPEAVAVLNAEMAALRDKSPVAPDMSQTDLRAVRAGETIWCAAEVVTRSPRTLYMTASVSDERRKLVATAQTQILIL